MVSYEDAISESARFIEGHLDEVLTVEDVAAAVGYSSFYFSRIFKEHFGMTVMEYVRKRRGPELLSIQGQDSAVFVKLAERLHNMRTLEFIDSSRFKAKAKETIEVYLPLAKEIGSDDFAEELYALSARYLV